MPRRKTTPTTEACPQCGRTDSIHLQGVASGRADIARGDTMQGSEALARRDGLAREGLANARAAINAAVAGSTRVRDRLEAESNWWLGYYHGRAAQREDLVDVPEIAHRAGVIQDTVRKWRQRHADFPAPMRELAIGPVWRWEDVQRWIAARRGLRRLRDEGAPGG